MDSIFLSRNINPPSRAYVRAGGRLRFRVRSVPADVAIMISGILLTTKGEMREISENLTTTGDGHIDEIFTPFPEGFIFSLTCSVLSDTVRHGEIYCHIALLRGMSGVKQPYQVLLAGYASPMFSPCFPLNNPEPAFAGKGLLRTVSYSSAITAVPFEIVIPRSRSWRFESIRTVFAPATVAGDRRVSIAYFVDNYIADRIHGHYAMSYTYDWELTWSRLGEHDFYSNKFQRMPLNQMVMRGGDKISIGVSGWQAGDTLENVTISATEWLSDNIS